MNIKNKCTKCGKELVYFRMVLAMGPKGYRRYAYCDKCADQAEKKAQTVRKVIAKLEAL
jgi:hypothetical protein